MQCSTSSLPQNILINLIAKHLNDIINRVEGKLRKHIMFRHFNNTVNSVERKIRKQHMGKRADLQKIEHEGDGAAKNWVTYRPYLRLNAPWAHWAYFCGPSKTIVLLRHNSTPSL